MTELRFCFFDTETTGKSPDARIIQFAAKKTIVGAPDTWETINEYFSPGVQEIEIGAMATHHITPKKLVGMPEFYSFIKTIEHLSENYVMVAHNAPFDVARLIYEGASRPPRVIDTLKIARHTLPELESFSLQYLRYYFGIYEILDASFLPVAAHDALGDVLVLEQVFNCLKNLFAGKFNIPDDPEELVKALLIFSSAPVRLARCPFGKHKGEKMEKVPTGWLKWALANIPDLEEDTRHTFEYHAAHNLT